MPYETLEMMVASEPQLAARILQRNRVAGRRERWALAQQRFPGAWAG